MACGLGSWSASQARLKRLPAIEIVRAMKRYKDSFKTFQYMTSPYVYPTTGIGATFAKASAKVLAANNGACLTGRPIDGILYDAFGRACGVTSEGVSVNAGCVVCAPQYVPEAAEEAYQVVRMYAVLAHAPHKCKDARSCRLLIPGSQVGRKHDIHMVCSGAAHRIAPADKWLAVLSTRVEGPIDGLSALQVRTAA
jgi:Rab GDP dissociation inhibitor